MNKAWNVVVAISVGMSSVGRADYRDSNAIRNLRESGVYVSNTYGSGHSSDGGDLQNRALELRFGKELVNPGLPEGSSVRIDFVYDNEGHPLNNHRDGFAGQIVFRQKVSDKVKIEAGVGPYFTFNTTTIDGHEIDDQRLGVLATAAVLYYLGNNGWHVRAQYNHAIVPGGPSTDAILFGVGKDTGVSHYRDSSNYAAEGSSWIGVSVGNSITNHGGTEPAKNASVEWMRYFSNGMAISAQAIHEGDDGSRTDRNGVAAQVWYVQPLGQKWAIGAGAGPYFAINKRGSNNVETNAIVSVRAERIIGSEKKGVKVFVDFSRVVSRDNNDRDMFRIGIQKKLK